MKYPLSIFTVLCLAAGNLCAQVPSCQDLIRLKDQKITDLDKDKSSLTRQNNELQTNVGTLQTKLITCLSGGGGGGGGGVTYEDDYKKAQKKITLLNDQIKEIERERDNKDALLKTANKDIDKLREEAASATKNNEAQAQDLKKITQELEDCRKKYAELNKAFQDSAKAVLVLKTDAQILYDSLYMSVDFINKGIVHIDSKLTEGKQVKLDDILLEIPYTIINGGDWSQNETDLKLKRIGALYIKYKDKLNIQLVCPQAATPEEGKKIDSMIKKTIGRISAYASFDKPSSEKVSLEVGKDILIESTERAKQEVIRISLIKRK